MCRKYIQTRFQDGVGAGTVRKELTFLRAAVNKFGSDAGARFELPVAPAPRERYLTREEFQRLLSELKTPHMNLFVRLALAAAGRHSALLELTWSRVNFEDSTIELAHYDEMNRRKGRARVKMNDSIRIQLEAARKAAVSDYVIQYNGKQVKSVRHAFDRAVKRCGWHDVTIHTLRHTAAVWMVHAGVDMKQISQFLGHTSINVTERVYAKYDPVFMGEAAAALEFEI